MTSKLNAILRLVGAPICAYLGHGIAIEADCQCGQSARVHLPL